MKSIIGVIQKKITKNTKNTNPDLIIYNEVPDIGITAFVIDNEFWVLTEFEGNWSFILLRNPNQDKLYSAPTKSGSILLALRFKRSVYHATTFDALRKCVFKHEFRKHKIMSNQYDAALIKERRLSLQFSSDQVADMCRVSYNVIDSIEHGFPISFSCILKVCKALDLSIDDVIKVKEKPTFEGWRLL